MSCKKIGKIVIASCRLHSINPRVAANLVYFVLPEGFRPSSNTSGIGYMMVYNSQGTSIGQFMLPVSIDTLGRVNVTYGAAYTTDQVFFYAVFTTS